VASVVLFYQVIAAIKDEFLVELHDVKLETFYQGIARIREVFEWFFDMLSFRVYHVSEQSLYKKSACG
jgi:hypothetical protein